MRRAGAILLAAAVLLPAAAAEAIHWPFFGGDNGRSGYQPVGEGRAPLTPLYAKTDASERQVKTSIINSTGSATTVTQRLIYGTANGRVHVQTLPDGNPVGPEEGVLIDDGPGDADVFGGPGGSVSFAETSGAPAPGQFALGQIFAVHNDDDSRGTANDISIAQVDETTGALVQDVPVPGTDGFTIESSPTASAGDGAIFFVASNGEDQRLFRVQVSAPQTTTATIGPATSTGDIDANPLASPSLAFLRDGVPEPLQFILVGTTAGTMRSFLASDLSEGAPSPDLGGPVGTPTIPSTPTGVSPGAPNSGALQAPFVYLPVARERGTQVVRIVQSPATRGFAVDASSEILPGAPAPALATDQAVVGSAAGEGRVAVTTAANFYVLTASTLATAARLSPTDLSGARGFARSTAAVSGDLAYVTRDDGEQLVLSLVNARPVAGFAQAPGNAGATASFGQPSITRSFVQFASDRGVFVFTNACGLIIRGTENDDRITGGIEGDSIGLLGGNDVADGGAGGDCLRGDAGDDDLSGGAESDELDGGLGADALRGGPGGDGLIGGAANDRLAGDDGGDVLGGSAGNDAIAGGAGNDTLDGNSGNDALDGGDGSDRLRGGAGSDVLTGGAGADVLEGGAGRNRYVGGAGNDRVNARNRRPDTVNCGPGRRDSATVDANDRVRGCERVLRPRRRR